MSIQSTFRVSTAIGLSATMAVLGVDGLHAAPGDLETGFTPTFLPAPDAVINTAVPQEDGSILVGGAFQGMLINGAANQSIRHAVRLTSGGAVDANYVVGPDNVVNSINVQFDGSAFYTGSFSYVKAWPDPTKRVSRPYIAKFGSTAILDNNFIPESPTPTFGIREHIQGKYLVMGEGGIKRLMSDFQDPKQWVADPGFTSYPYPAVWHADIQNDSRVLISGSFSTATTTVNRDYVDRLAADGQADLGYIGPVLNNQGVVHSAIFQPDQKILLCGQFVSGSVTPVAGNTTTLEQPGIIRLNAIGQFDETFRPAVGGSVLCMALQADGKILIGGNFTQVASTTNGTTTTLTRRGIARLNGDGSVDPTFDAKINASIYGHTVRSITILGDGKLLITGDFQAFNNVLRSEIARLSNDAATSDLRAVNSTTVRWDAGGASPVATAVVFEFSINGTSGWTKIPSVTNPTFFNGTWETSSYMDLPNPCFLRVRAQIPGGLHGSSYGTMITPTAKYPLPRLALTRDPSTNVTRDSTVQLGYVGTGTTWDFPFTVRNIGTSNLTISSVTITGTDASKFSIVQSPASTVAGPLGTTPFIIRFSPDSNAEKNATVTIASNTPEWPSFVMKLKGSGIATEIEGWRYQYFGVTTDTGNALGTSDPDGDGHTNAFEFTAGLNPTSKTSRFSQVVQATSGASKLVFSPRLTNRTYVVESSTSLQTGSWAAATGTNADSGTQRTFTDSAAYVPGRFYRVKITKP